jgi:hypothetical protein
MVANAAEAATDGTASRETHRDNGDIATFPSSGIDIREQPTPDSRFAMEAAR